MHRTASSLSLVALAFTLACGDDEVGFRFDATRSADAGPDAAQPDAGPAPTLAAVCDPTEGLFVDLFTTYFACYPELELWLGAVPDAAELEAACLGFLEPFLDDGTVELGTAAAFAACAAYIAEIDCLTANLDAPNPCDALVIGTLAVGEDCDANDQCAGDSYCDRSAGETCGTCAPRKPDNANCYLDTECANRRCSGVDGDLPGMCRAFGEVGDDCVVDDDCGGRVICNQITGKCQVARTWTEGDTCDSFSEDCGFPLGDLYCNEGLGECVAYLDVGEECAGVGLCRFLAYETCDNLGTRECTAPVIVNEGQSCGWTAGRKCGAGLVCSNPTDDPPPGVCVAQPAIGDSCTDTAECGLLMSCVSNECQYGEHTGQCPAAN